MPKEIKQAWEVPVQFLKGVGEKIAKQLANHEIKTFWDLLFHLPRKYEDRRKFYTFQEIEKEANSGNEVLAIGKIEAYTRRMAGRRRWSEAICRVDGHALHPLYLVWFQDYGGSIQKTYPAGTSVVFTGKVQSFRGRLQIVHPQMQKTESEKSPWEFGTIIPVYKEISRISSRVFRRVMYQALQREEFKSIPEALPESIKEEFQFPDLARSLSELHFPRSWEPSEDNGQNQYYRRVVFEELFMMSLALFFRKNNRKQEDKKNEDLVPALKIENAKQEKIISALPFPLTGDQKKVLTEIHSDMALAHNKQAMHRLVQGDVGSGKTIVAFLSMITAAENGFQSALMAPTEILADQHFRNFQVLFPERAHQAIILKGALKAKDKKEIREKLKSGELLYIIGTQALVAEATHFYRLGLVIIDEQHRFGVAQRLALKNREDQFIPHFLVMTATPIPRSLALTFYGDLSLSQIKEKPKGRIPIKTYLIKQRAQISLAKRLNELLKEGRQIYMVYPLIEESEEMDLKDVKSAFADWQKRFPQHQVALLHGRMKSKEKDEVMRQFKSNECQVLVSTTVIEVGVDVPNASVIVIEHAERFGLSQLHQLRGRVGRGAQESLCILVGPDRMSETVEERLNVMVQSSDGFYIAEKDLEIRGPGEFLGRRQSGIPGFKAAHILRDLETLELARQKAQEIIEIDPLLENPDHQLMKKMLMQWWGDRMDLTLSG